MKLVTGTLQEMTDLEHQIFVFGAPFRATFFDNSTWDEESLSMIGSKPNGARTTKLQSPQPIEEGSETYFIVHIDEMPFAPTTFAEYASLYPDDEVLLSRIPEGDYDDYTPQQYVSEVIIGASYSILNV